MILNNRQIHQIERSQSRTRNAFDLGRSTGSNKNSRPKSSFGCQRTKTFDKESDSEQTNTECFARVNFRSEANLHKATNDSIKPQKWKPPFHPGRSQTIRFQSAGRTASNITVSREKDSVRRNYSNKVKGLNIKGLHLYEEERNRYCDNDINSPIVLDSGRFPGIKNEGAKLKKSQTFCFRRHDELIPVGHFLKKRVNGAKLSQNLKDINAQLRQTLKANFLIPETNTAYELVTKLYEQHQKLVKLYFCKQNADQASETDHSPTPQQLLQNAEFFKNPMFSTIDFNMSNPSSNVSFAGFEQPQNTSRPKNPEARMEEIISLLNILSEENELLIQNMETKELWSEGNSPTKTRHSIKEEESERIAQLSQKTETVIGQNNWIVKRLEEIEFQIGMIQQKHEVMTPLPNLEELQQEEEMEIMSPHEVKEEDNANFDQMYYTCIMEDEIQDQKLLNATLKEKINLIEISAEKRIQILEFNLQRLSEENNNLKEELKRREEALHLELQKKDEKIQKLEDELKKVTKMSATFSHDDYEEEYRVDKMKKQIEKDIFEFSQKMAQKQREIAMIEEKLSFSHIQEVSKSLKPQGLKKPTRFKSAVPYERLTQTTGCSESEKCKFEVESGKLCRMKKTIPRSKQNITSS